jgi:ribose-phosphate pyrophosphokinase
MIKINGEVVNINKFPDGTPKINIDPDCIKEEVYDGSRWIDIDWLYENNDELFYLLLVKKHLERHFTDVNYALYTPYIPNARMDRTKNDDEVFTLKYFCEFINSLNFTAVYVLDAHSDVSTALLNNCMKENVKQYITWAIAGTGLSKDPVLYFPDAGAAKRYSDLFPELMYCYGEKRRDWKTGQILGLDVKTNGIDLTGKTILMIDDIISYGGSLFYSAQALKDLGVGKIYAYATHTENTMLDPEKGTLIKSLDDGTIIKLFTTGSIFTKWHEKIEVIEL